MTSRDVKKNEIAMRPCLVCGVLLNERQLGFPLDPDLGSQGVDLYVTIGVGNRFEKTIRASGRDEFVTAVLCNACLVSSAARIEVDFRDDDGVGHRRPWIHDFDRTAPKGSGN